jgi:hypothetical protein
MANIRCDYVFPNNTKSHKKNDVCNIVLRRKNTTKCWRHAKKEEINEEIEIDIDLDENIQNTNDNVLEKTKNTLSDSNFIQLVNS